MEKNLILSLDVSTKCIGISLFEDKPDKPELKLLHHVSPKVKPEPESKCFWSRNIITTTKFQFSIRNTKPN